MRSIPQFLPGNNVITLVTHDDRFNAGTKGAIASRWVGTIYNIKLPSGRFFWADSTELSSIDPSNPRIRVGDMTLISSNHHNHPSIKVGDYVKVMKIMEDADYYGLFLNNELHWLPGFELAPDI